MTESAEQQLRAYWKRVQYAETGLTSAGPSYVTINAEDHPTAGSTIFMEHGPDKETVFNAALAFTEQHKEEVRQLEEEIAQIGSHADMALGDIVQIVKYDHAEDSEYVVIRVRDLCEYSRTLARLQELLNAKLQGTRRQG